MNSSNWIQFRWDLTRLPKFDAALPEHYEITPGTTEDEAELRKIISASFVLDPAWNAATHEVIEAIEPWLQRAFASPATNCLALRHGLRIIGAAIISQGSPTEIHLSPGPCVSLEYRNRGFGTRLLEQSLTKLREAGLKEAVGIAHENAPAAKFLYTKFNSKASKHDSKPLVAA